MSRKDRRCVTYVVLEPEVEAHLYERRRGRRSLGDMVRRAVEAGLAREDLGVGPVPAIGRRLPVQLPARVEVALAADGRDRAMLIQSAMMVGLNLA
ncbi:hypothetical protein [Donghicola mangrovi]|uniref:Uncharacterized protein n=1 Tax=Donghicola mangrovi TaxID=2729614 RepID=A0A850Q385_9RHOB|nr:hypothetical protein [Donghicola mangrovi]NVO24117.1 hypothetical protein [Donghicola mangrovi]